MSITRRLGALVAASALTLSGVALVASPAQAAPDPRPQQQAATWLEGQLTGGLLHNPAFGGFDDYGLSADTALALAEIGGHGAAVTTIANALRDNFYNYAAPFGETVYAGAIAKALVVAQVAGTSPATYRNAINNQLIDTLNDTAPNKGRIQNQNETDFNPPYGPVDSANVFGQAFAVRALYGSGAGQKADALAFLLAQQCADGGFREKLDAKTDVNQSCEAGDTATYGDRIGATATALLNIADLTAEPGVTAAITAGKAFLVGQQNADGSFGTGGGNANSTGLAAWALGSGDEAVEAAQWLRDHQADDTDACTGFRAGNIGAVAFTQDSLETARAEGVTDETVGEFQRATSQALVALSLVEAPATTPTLSVTGPTGYVRAGSVATYKVLGANPGSRLCVTGGTAGKAGTANANGELTTGIVLPAGTANRVIRVVDAHGNSDTVVAKVLGAKVLKVTPAARKVRKGTSVRVTVSGLAAGETVTLRYRGAVVATGRATTAGTFTRKVAVGKKTGTRAISAAGQFPAIRKGAASIKVVR